MKEHYINALLWMFIAWYMILRPFNQMCDECSLAAIQIQKLYRQEDQTYEILQQQFDQARNSKRKDKKQVRAKQQAIKDIGGWDVFKIKYLKGLCGCRSKYPIFVDSKQDLIVLNGLRRLYEEKKLSHILKINKKFLNLGKI